jgi:DNA-binding NtrC family response regulator
MPARVVIVHDDIEFLTALEIRLREAGHDVGVFKDPVSGFDALTSARHVEVLVTRVLFRPGPHGIALANAARITRPSLKVIFTASPEFAYHAQGEGRVFTMPVHPAEIAQAVQDMLSTPPALNTHLPPPG